MAGGKIIGGPFSSEVIDQLALRSTIVSKDARTNNDLIYLTGRTGWVKFTSGVNVGGSSNLAQKYVLAGGVAGRTGADTYSNFTGDGKGFRPMPGITGVQINSVGQFGQLKQATVTFNCWDRSQITELELIFMRPGFTALLEWGHSIYATSQTEYVKVPQTITSFFTKGTTKEKLYQEIAALRKKSKGNYEGMFGFIKNFSWKYRPDGGYDCTTDLISIGEIMESLTIDVDTASVTKTEASEGDVGTVVPATMLQDVLKTIRETGAGAGAWEKIVTKFPEFASKFETVNEKSGLSLANLPLDSVVNSGKAQPPKAGNKFVYVSLQSFCELVNTLIIVDTNKKNVIRLNNKIAPLGDNTSDTPYCRFRTYKFHTSSDPGACILLTPGSKNWPYREDLLAAIDTNRVGSSDEILNIYVNVNLLESAIASLVLAKEKSERTLLNLFEPIFKELNETLGGINDIGFQYEEDEYTYYIVDRKAQVEDKDVTILNITGLKSTVTQFNFTTKLSPAITTMCAISAQAGAADVGLEAGALLRWNEGLEDRIIGKKTVKADDSDDGEKLKQQTDRRKIVKDALSQIYNSRIYDQEAVTAARTNYAQYSSNYVQYYAEDGENSVNAGPAGIIPFEVQIEMDGISGIKLGQAFRINPGIMPSKYDGVVGFIVTGQDHSITGNRWVTNLKAQTIVLRGKVDKAKSPTYSDDFEKDGTAKKSKEKKGLRGTGSVSKTLKNEYIPALEKAVPNGSKGIKLLITAQTQMEGFAPGTKSYRTNNPGNIGNTDNGGTNKFDTLDAGVKGQYDYAVKVALNQNKNYKIGARKTAPAIYDKDSAQNYPGIDFTYKGTLDQYLKIYSTGARKYDTYLNLVVGYFARNGYTITGETTLKQIHDIA